FVKMENVAREGWHQDRVRPAENSDDREESENGPDANMIPDVANSFERLRERPPARGARNMRRQPHHEETGEDSEEAGAIDEKAERDPNLGHQETSDRGTNDASAVEHCGIQ